MKRLIFLLLLYVPLPNGFSTSIYRFEDNFYYKHNILTKDEVIDKTNLETKFIISEIEYQIHLKKNRFKNIE